MKVRSPEQIAAELLLNGEYITIPLALVELIGLEKAIFVQKLDGWCKSNELHQKHQYFHNEYYWTIGSYEYWHDQMPWLGSPRTIQRICLTLEEEGLVVAGIFNSNKGDRRKWYRVDREKLGKLYLSKLTQADPPDKQRKPEETPGTSADSIMPDWHDDHAKLAPPSCQIGTTIMPDWHDDHANLAPSSISQIDQLNKLSKQIKTKEESAFSASAPESDRPPLKIVPSPSQQPAEEPIAQQAAKTEPEPPQQDDRPEPQAEQSPPVENKGSEEDKSSAPVKKAKKRNRNDSDKADKPKEQGSGRKQRVPAAEAYKDLPESGNFEKAWEWYRALCARYNANPGDKALAAVRWREMVESGVAGEGLNLFRDGAATFSRQQAKQVNSCGIPHFCYFIAGSERHPTPYWISALQFEQGSGIVNDFILDETENLSRQQLKMAQEYARDEEFFVELAAKMEGKQAS